MAILPMLFTAAHAEFSDIDNIPEKDAVIRLYERGIVEGTGETTYSPSDNLTRAQFAAFAVRAFENSEGQGMTFSDVVPGSWYEGYVNTASYNGYINGYNGLFKPDDFVTHEEAAKILVCAFEKNAEEINSPLAYLTDAADIFYVSDWAREYVGKGIMLGIVPYTIQDERPYTLNINPTGYTTRAEAAAMLDGTVKAVENYKQRVLREE